MTTDPLNTATSRPPGPEDWAYQAHILPRVSRTFALTIPELPDSLEQVVANGYLLCRIADSIEDEPGIDGPTKRRLQGQFADVVDGLAEPEVFALDVAPRLSAQIGADEHDLVRHTPDVIRITLAFDPRQRRALDVVLECLTPGFLDIPDDTLELFAPRTFGYRENREMFDGASDPAFDSIAAAATAADLVVRGLLNTERCARLIDQKRRDDAQLGLRVVLQELTNQVFFGLSIGPRHTAIKQGVQQVVVSRMMELAADETGSPLVRAQAESHLVYVADVYNIWGQRNEPDAPQAAYLARQIKRFLKRALQAVPVPVGPPEAPPGSPIGHGGYDLGRCSHGR